MILEIADIRVIPGTQAAFEAAIAKGIKEIIANAKGFMGYKINKGIKLPERYVLMIFWQTLENHTVDFRQSAAFAEWRALVGPYFAGLPVVEHFELLSESASVERVRQAPARRSAASRRQQPHFGASGK